MDTDLPSLPLRLRWDKYKNVVFIALSVCVCLTALSIKLRERKKQSETDYVAATGAFDRWEQVIEKDHEGLKQLTGLIKKHPELSPKYDARLAQHFIAAEESEQAQVFGSKVLERTQQPYFQDYALASLLISERNYSEALAAALDLKEKFLNDSSFWEKSTGIKSFGSSLFAFNLLRIATLYQEIGMKVKEKEAWSELKAYAGWSGEKKDNRIPEEGFQSLLVHFTVQDITLLDYINARENELSQ